MKSLGRMTILVKDYEESIAFYTAKLGFKVFVDIDAGPSRYVHLRLPPRP